MKKRILIVDDEQDILDMLERVLVHAGYDVTKTTSGKEAIRLAKTEQPNLIMLDVKMPDFDGEKTSDILKSDTKTRNIPLVFRTALVDKKDVVDGHVSGSKIGNLYFIPKNFSSEQLLEIVKKVIK